MLVCMVVVRFKPWPAAYRTAASRITSSYMVHLPEREITAKKRHNSIRYLNLNFKTNFFKGNTVDSRSVDLNGTDNQWKSDKVLVHAESKIRALKRFPRKLPLSGRFGIIRRTTDGIVRSQMFTFYVNRSTVQMGNRSLQRRCLPSMFRRFFRTLRKMYS